MTVPLALDIERLTIEERIELAQALWDSIEPGEDDDVLLSPAQIAELDRRWGEHLKNTGSGSTWDEVKARVAGPSNGPSSRCHTPRFAGASAGRWWTASHT